mmetsp:Transcript_92324/g.246947  ORF Transcript_92324/g.246947 Transcript_92324/m.246947 type:complete len:376 (+) Transcript_92324:13-1140(+)
MATGPRLISPPGRPRILSPIVFEEFIPAANLQPLQELSRLRANLQASLESDLAIPGAIDNHVDAARLYVQHLHAMADAGPHLAVTKGPVIHWKSALAPSMAPVRELFRTFKQAMNFELIMSLTALADAYLKKAAELMAAADWASAYKEAAGLVAQASGIYQYCKDWTAEGITEVLGPRAIPEVNENVMSGLHWYSNACLQTIALEIAVASGAKQLTLLAKLCRQVAVYGEQASAHLASSGLVPILNHLHVLVPLMDALGMVYMGRAIWAEGQYGVGVAWCRKAQAQIDQVDQYYTRAVVPCLEEFRMRVMPKMKEDIAFMEKDNQYVYFEPVKVDQLPPLHPQPVKQAIPHTAPSPPAFTVEGLGQNVAKLAGDA